MHIDPDISALDFSRKQVKLPETAPAIQRTALASAVALALTDIPIEDNWQADTNAEADFNFIA